MTLNTVTTYLKSEEKFPHVSSYLTCFKSSFTFKLSVVLPDSLVVLSLIMMKADRDKTFSSILLNYYILSDTNLSLV